MFSFHPTDIFGKQNLRGKDIAQNQNSCLECVRPDQNQKSGLSSKGSRVLDWIFLLNLLHGTESLDLSGPLAELGLHRGPHPCRCAEADEAHDDFHWTRSQRESRRNRCKGRRRVQHWERLSCVNPKTEDYGIVWEERKVDRAAEENSNVRSDESSKAWSLQSKRRPHHWPAQWGKVET